MSQPSPSHIWATAIRALATATLRRLTLSVLYTIVTNSYQTICTVSKITFNKRQHANARQGVDLITTTPHYDSRNVPSDQAKHIAKNAWRDKTVVHKEGVLQRWLKFAKESKISEYDLTFDNIMSFLEFLRTTVQTYAMVKRAKEMLVVLCKITGDPFKMGNLFLLEKYMAASFNTHPPTVLRPGSMWDINVLLDYFVKLGLMRK